jgi:hypothetical protein
MHSRLPPPSRRPGSWKIRGSGLGLALIYASVLTTVIASMLRWVTTESSLNQRTMARLEAANAAEAIAEYGMVQVRYRMQNSNTFSANSFTPSGASPLVLPSSSLFAGTRVDATANALTGGTLTNIITAATPATNLYFVDPTDLNNINDPMRSKWIVRRDIPIYAKTKVTPISGPPIYAYVREKISVRGAPLFAHAIFFNMDLEISPGPTMNVSGPVHANGDIYPNAQYAPLNFTDVVSCTGHIFHAAKGVSEGGANMTNDVTFVNRVGNLVTQISADASGTWKDSTMGVSTTVQSNKASYATQAAYYAALLAGATTNATAFRTHASTTWHGSVQTKPHGIQPYTPVAVIPYIEDVAYTDGVDQSVNAGRLIIEPPTATSSPEYSAEVEAQKFSTQAGVYIKIVPASGYANTTTVSGSTTTVVTRDPTVPAVVTVRVGSATGPLATSIPAGLVTYYPYKQTATTTSGVTTYNINRGMYDQRRLAGQDLVELDITKLKAAVAAIGTSSSHALPPLSAAHWTGVVYLEVTSNPTTRLNGTTIAAAGGANVSIRLINGAVQVPSTGMVAGLTIATNAPLYIKGNFNDTSATGTSPTVPRTGEVPACIAADAVTLLSSGFVDADSRDVVQWGPVVSGPTVVAAAILSGFVPWNKDNNGGRSGGAPNLVRYLESWNPTPVTLRGSLVALFECRVAVEPRNNNIYGAPTRHYGFCDLLKNGRFPPGTPRVMSYRRVDYTDLTKAEYDAAIAGL